MLCFYVFETTESPNLWDLGRKFEERETIRAFAQDGPIQPRAPNAVLQGMPGVWDLRSRNQEGDKWSFDVDSIGK
jgi:hypothetical protein